MAAWQGSASQVGNTELYCGVLYWTILYSTELYCGVLYWTLLYCTELYCGVVHCTGMSLLYCKLYCTALYCTVCVFSAMPFSLNAVQCSAVQCSAVQCSAVQCRAGQGRAVQCSAMQCSVKIGGNCSFPEIECTLRLRVICISVGNPNHPSTKPYWTVSLPRLEGSQAINPCPTVLQIRQGRGHELDVSSS